MTRWRFRIAAVVLALVAALGLWMARPAGVRAALLDEAVAAGDEASSPSAGLQMRVAGGLRFEVEPDDVEIYLDERYLGRAGELRGREVEGVRAGNRLVDLRWGGERTFLEVLVPSTGTRTVRLDLNPSGPRKFPVKPAAFAGARPQFLNGAIGNGPAI